MHFGDPHIMSE